MQNQAFVLQCTFKSNSIAHYLKGVMMWLKPPGPDADSSLHINQSINQSINQFYSPSWDLCTDPSDYLHVLS